MHTIHTFVAHRMAEQTAPSPPEIPHFNYMKTIYKKVILLSEKLTETSSASFQHNEKSNQSHKLDCVTIFE